MQAYIAESRQAYSQACSQEQAARSGTRYANQAALSAAFLAGTMRIPCAENEYATWAVCRAVMAGAGAGRPAKPHSAAIAAGDFMRLMQRLDRPFHECPKTWRQHIEVKTLAAGQRPEDLNGSDVARRDRPIRGIKRYTDRLARCIGILAAAGWPT